MATYEDKVFDHEIDGIREYNNPLPGWLMASLWGSVILSAGYIAFYALAFPPASMKGEYRQAAVKARTELHASYIAAHPIVPPSTEELVAGAVDAKTVGAGQVHFARTCARCHGPDAEGLIGPNLADDSWQHGGQVRQVFNTIVNGVPAKGMPPWGRAIAPEEIAALVSYIRSVQGTTPANPKTPEREPVVAEPLPGE